MRSRGREAWHDLARDTAAQDEAAALLARVGLSGRETSYLYFSDCEAPESAVLG